MAPRWKGKSAEAKALAEPMSKFVSNLQSSLIESNIEGFLSGCSMLVAANPEQTELFNKACFGRPIVTAEKDEQQWFQLSLEEAFYLSSLKKCIKIAAAGEGERVKIDEDLWNYYIAVSKKPDSIIQLVAYSHLRAKNWVVRGGSQYGVDFVAYRHHPSLVHSEYAVLVLSNDEKSNDRLRVWSDVHCALRLCGSVAKTLLALFVGAIGDTFGSPRLEDYAVEERIIARWNPEQSREDQQPTSSSNVP
ncbi:tRNA-splicing endonuclease subunit Sen2-2-like [Andrographis paniculata]|uniref:tRNA-splicing endonuclease subunit Sen2-2-like n=1 Tax=Andrographis paniculata TaxID=175694 RepID=UPI0021E78D54|nr:tRNA-splicing endonuclease subunit Sen2-2-like [Andrographis paniculata]XP_051146904.1 tRNA-splicing endonuclease subunit Sen2-2-like [Andrographis paniculata]XP_051146905.1 tRNA-splicing endonuclease subunit Sen2-2-like [Andrographis paniculata]XP_051146906.1 tRNA-splicing endonuclease subunit Sen2-2-like [Andrographis paniculata]XP_051146907.1 tRNA-splicing endonuclease subunit Sen2-2-like [Andrographis paniculata]XP_051146908.1 tRNA-splicing endonuclease subunit Sen2-2-like [Andrographis